jgi:CopG family nickel-responsive transcriptional regulator
MTALTRLSMSLEQPLLEQLEQLVAERGYANRSEYFRDLIRDQLVQREWAQDQQVVGTITLLYNHLQRQLSERLTQLQHHHHHQIMATTHVHLDEAMCVEMILARGTASELRHLLSHLQQQRGVVHAAMSMTSTGRALG